MSKAKPKQKKAQNNSAQQQLIEQQKRQIIESGFTIQRLQDRISRMLQQHHQVTTTRDKVQEEYQTRIDKQRVIIQSHQNNIRQNRQKICDLQVCKLTLQGKLRDMQRQLRQLQNLKNKQLDQFRRITQTQITKLQAQLKQYNIYMGQRDQMSYNNINLKRNLQDQKEQRVKQVADKQRQKIQAIDRLRDQMLNKIKDMRSNLLSLKKQQLDTTTRLAVLQNHQLTSQLQFQSRQSQKLVFENEQLLKKVANLQKDLQIHKQIQQQLAKRSHYSRGIIKKLTSRIAQLQQNIKALQSQLQKNKQNQISNQQKDQMIKVLDHNLQLSQQKISKLQMQIKSFKQQFLLLKNKNQTTQKRGSSFIQFLFKNYQKFQEQQLQVQEGGFQIDLKNLRKKKVQEWSKQQLKTVLIAILQPSTSFLTRKNLGMKPLFSLNQTSVMDTDETINNVRLPRISQHSVNLKLEVSNKLKQLPVSIGGKIVGSQLREWGRTVHSSSHANLNKKLKIYQNK